MRLHPRNFIFILIFACLGVQVQSRSPLTRTQTPLHFVSGAHGQAILSNLDQTLAENAWKKHFLNSQKLNFLNREDADLTPPGDGDPMTLPASLGALWNNTAMVFGASADGIGIGTTFSLADGLDHTALFVTNLHVLDHFCSIPGSVTSSQELDHQNPISCQSLYILHDIAINTITSRTQIDGGSPWKSEVHSLLYFDKKLDLAVFRIATPTDFNLAPNPTETTFDPKNPRFAHQEALTIPSQEAADPAATEVLPLDAFSVFLIAYSIPDRSQDQDEPGLIRKKWFHGSNTSVRAFENKEKRGMISAIQHDIEIRPGSSGAPLTLSDGRVVGVNASVEAVEFFGKSGCSKQLETYYSYYAIPTAYLNAILPLFIQGDPHA